MSTPEEWYRGLPLVTKVYFTAAVATTILTSLGVVSPMLLYLDFDKILYKFNFWRLVTSFLYFGSFGLPFVFSIVMLVRTFQDIEKVYYNGSRGRAEFIMCVAFGMVGCYLVHALWMPSPFPGSILIFYIMYIWSRKSPMQPLTMYGFAFKAWHLPFVFMLIHVLMGSSPMIALAGILVGHTYHFLMDIVPAKYGKTYLWCPSFLYNFVEQWSTGAPVPVQAFARGQGHRLE